MKKLISFLIALGLVIGILLAAVADVNHGYGPGYHYVDDHGSDGDEHSEDEHDAAYDDHGVTNAH